MNPAIEAVLRNTTVFLLAFSLKKFGYFEQKDGQRAVTLVVNFLVPMSLLANISRVDLELSWLMLPMVCWGYAILTLPLLRLVFYQIFRNDLEKTQEVLTCKPGKMGIECDDAGYVKDVEKDGQADSLGKRIHRILQITVQDGIATSRSYSRDALAKAEAGTDNYDVVLQVSNLDRSDIGQMLVCCTGGAVTLVGYPIMHGFYDQAGLVRTAMYDCGNFFLAYVGTLVLSSNYSPKRTSSDRERGVNSATAGTVNNDQGNSAILPLTAAPAAENATPASPKRRRSMVEHTAALVDAPDPNSALAKGRSVRDLAAAAREPDATPAALATVIEANSGKGEAFKFVAITIKKVLFQLPTMGFLAGAILRTVSIQVDQLPKFLFDAIQGGADSCNTLAICALGLFFEPSYFLKKKYFRRLGVLLILKYGCAVSTAVLVHYFFPSKDPLLSLTAGICLTMPTPPVVIHYALQEKFDETFAAMVVNASLVVAFIVSFILALVFGPSQ